MCARARARARARVCVCVCVCVCTCLFVFPFFCICSWNKIVFQGGGRWGVGGGASSPTFHFIF